MCGKNPFSAPILAASQTGGIPTTISKKTRYLFGTTCFFDIHCSTRFVGQNSSRTNSGSFSMQENFPIPIIYLWRQGGVYYLPFRNFVLPFRLTYLMSKWKLWLFEVSISPFGVSIVNMEQQKKQSVCANREPGTCNPFTWFVRELSANAFLLTSDLKVEPKLGLSCVVPVGKWRVGNFRIRSSITTNNFTYAYMEVCARVDLDILASTYSYLPNKLFQSSMIL
jgi:hypothetical protein